MKRIILINILRRILRILGKRRQNCSILKAKREKCKFLKEQIKRDQI